jgi:hypothetical protein
MPRVWVRRAPGTSIGVKPSAGEQEPAGELGLNPEAIADPYIEAEERYVDG